MIATCREQGYEADDRWAQSPAGWSWSEATAVATDSRDRVFVFNRGEHPVMVFDRDGTFLASWGEGLFARPHGISIGPDDAVYCTDDLDHTVRKFTPDGRLLLTLGTSGKPSDTGATSMDFRTIRRAGPPFHYPTQRRPCARTANSTSATATATPASTSSRPTAGSSSRGASRAAGRGSSTSRTASPSTATAPSSSPTARTAASSSSRPTASSSPNGPTSPGRARSSSTATGSVYVAELGYRAGHVAGHDGPEPRRHRRPRERLRSEAASCWPAGAAATNPPRRATSSPRTTSASIRAATSTSPR